jgi:phosphatidylserine/phosphatidylglycerophosphate/cardiolipin synthase-like enzyme
MATPVRSRLDTVFGDGVETAIRAKHRLRLRRLGWGVALNPPLNERWVRAGTPPREGCTLEVLIDGAQALPEMARAMAEAREYIHMTGWSITAAFELVRGEDPVVLGRLLAELAERIDVRVLLWAGAPVPIFHPSRAEVRDEADNLVRGTRIRCERDPREHPFHCHHEKTIVIDGRLAFVGGIDITDSAGDRFDTSAHPSRRRLGWHDVAGVLRGPAVADVDRHFALRWEELTGELPELRPPPPRAGDQTVQVVRTVCDGMYDRIPRGEFSILESYVRALRSAERLIYLENQFLWSPEIVPILAGKLRRPPTPEFRMILLLPAKPNNGKDDTLGQLSLLADADGGAGRLQAVTIRSLSEGRDDPLYVHAKVGIVDDRWLTLGSANLNDHSLFNDTEMNVVTDDAELARETRVRLWAEHLELDRSIVASAEPWRLVDERWGPIAEEQLARQRAGQRPTHRLLRLPGVSRRARRLLGPLQGLIDDG